MAKKTKVAYVRMQIKPGEAAPGPPIAPAIGPHGVNIMEFCKSFNAKTSDMKGTGYVLPVKVTVYSDRSFEFTVGAPTTSSLIKVALGIKSGSKTPGSANVAVLTREKALEIVKQKMGDLTASHRSAAIKTIVGCAKSMGIASDFEIDEVTDGGQ